MKPDEKVLISWNTPEYVYIESSNDWLWTVIIFTIAGTVLSIITKNFILAIIILTSGVLLWLLSKRKPTDIDVKVTNYGIYIHDSFFPYKNLEYFHIETEHLNTPHIIVSKKDLDSLAFSLPLINADIEELKEILTEYLIETEIKEPSLHRYIERIGY